MRRRIGIPIFVSLLIVLSLPVYAAELSWSEKGLGILSHGKPIIAELGLTALSTRGSQRVSPSAYAPVTSKGSEIMLAAKDNTGVPGDLDRITIRVKSKGDDDSISISVLGADGSPLPYAWSYGGLLSWSDRPLMARYLKTGINGNPDMVQTALGPYQHRELRTVYDPISDKGLEVKGGDPRLTFDHANRGYTLQGSASSGSDPLFELNITRDVYRKGLGVKYYAPIDKERFPLPPSGWCSWYFYYQNLGEKDIMANADWMAENLKPYGAGYIQVDDAWQGRGTGVGDNRDWTTIAPRFSGGMKALADHIRSLGMKPGLWLAPHGQSNEAVANRNKDAFLWRKDGTSIGRTNGSDNWEGRYIADTSGPAGQQYMKGLFTTLSQDWGYDYFKIDGQPIVESIYTDNRQLLDDPKAMPLDSYRKGLEAIRDAIGPDRYLLGCWGTPMGGIGIMNGSRTGGDITATWDGMMPMLDATLNGYYLHNIAWYSDPDTLCVRSPQTMDQARVWASLMGLTGQALMASDKMTALPEQRVELLKRVFPATDIRPVDLYQYKGKPTIWDLRVNSGADSWDVVGVFNWSKRMETKDLDLSGLGMDGSGFHVYDFWNKEYMGIRSGKMKLLLPPTSCRVFSVHRVSDTPQVISTNRHITQGWLDLKETAWDSASLELRGTSDILRGDAYEVAVAIPAGCGLKVADSSSDLGDATITQESSCVVLSIKANKSGLAHWRIRFAKGGPTVTEKVVVPHLSTKIGTGSRLGITLEWNGQQGHTYGVYRNGTYMGEVQGTRITDETVNPDSDYEYTIADMNGDGLGTRSNTASFHTAKLEYVNLCDLTPKLSTQEWGNLGIDKSVDGNTLTIEGRTYDRGLGTHAKSEQVYDLAGAFKSFTAEVGVDDEVGGNGSVEFKVYTDGKLAWKSGILKGSGPGKSLAIPVTGIKELRLVTESGADNYYDHADWADPRLNCK